MPTIVTAPIAEGQPVAELRISLNGDDLVDEPLRALQEKPKRIAVGSARETVYCYGLNKGRQQ